MLPTRPENVGSILAAAAASGDVLLSPGLVRLFLWTSVPHQFLVDHPFQPAVQCLATPMPRFRWSHN